MSRLFAQATLLPNGGASNAQDFQPQGRNPQNPVDMQNTQQQQGGLQNPTTQEVLGRTDLKITVPTTTTAQVTEAPVTTETVSNYNWSLILVITVLVIGAATYIMTKQHKKRKNQTGSSSPTGPQEVLLVPEEEKEFTEEDKQPEAMPAAAVQVPSKKKAKKSKSKRKHK